MEGEAIIQLRHHSDSSFTVVTARPANANAQVEGILCTGLSLGRPSLGKIKRKAPNTSRTYVRTERHNNGQT